MKATGIVRNIDELGRVVIPKELRRTLGIHNGDPVEIFTSENGLIVLRKYQAGDEAQRIEDLMKYFADSKTLSDDVVCNIIGLLEKAKHLIK